MRSLPGMHEPGFGPWTLPETRAQLLPGKGSTRHQGLELARRVGIAPPALTLKLS